ncbi:MAG: IS1 family transposase, partial [Alphaproteobacteria bacterium]|nr:IS1 family transposase [Alphaproteobacteria bacterium]
PGKRKSLRKLIDNIDANNLKIVCTDGNFAYEEELSMNANIKHVISKSEICLVESYNSVLRYHIARLHCKTKCYSKSIQMLELSIALFLHSRMLLC